MGFNPTEWIEESPASRRAECRGQCWSREKRRLNKCQWSNFTTQKKHPYYTSRQPEIQAAFEWLYASNTAYTKPSKVGKTFASANKPAHWKK